MNKEEVEFIYKIREAMGEANFKEIFDKEYGDEIKELTKAKKDIENFFKSYFNDLQTISLRLKALYVSLIILNVRDLIDNHGFTKLEAMKKVKNDFNILAYVAEKDV